MKLRHVLCVLVVLLTFLTATSRLKLDRRAEGRQQLEDTLRRTAVSCYAAEGFYPPDVAYMQEHYGLQITDPRYVIHYTYIASNLMPDITVLEQ